MLGVLWAALGIISPVHPGKLSFPSAQQGEATPRELCSVVDSPKQKRCGCMGESPEKVCREDEGIGVLYM